MSDTELLPKPEPVRRVEVFTGAGRRRAWTAGEKARIVAESYEVGQTVSAVARRHALTPQQLFAWRRHARREVQDKTGAHGLGFAPVVVESTGAVSGMRLCGSAMIEIAIGAATVRVASGADAATLTAVLRALGGAR